MSVTICGLTRKPPEGERTGDETLEEGLVGEVRVVLLEVLLGGSNELQGDELEAAEISVYKSSSRSYGRLKQLTHAARSG